MPAAAKHRLLPERALEVLRRAGNPFRNYFARNPDDEVCARYHVPELFAPEREQLLGVVDLYRYEPGTHSEVVPVLGNKGAGKTHLLHSIKHGSDGAWQLLVTPGTYQKDTRFPRIPAVPGDRHAARRRQAEGHAGRSSSSARSWCAGCSAQSLSSTDGRSSGSTCSRRRAWAAGRAGSASAAPGPGTHPVAARPAASRPRARGFGAGELRHSCCIEASLDRGTGLRAGLPARRANRGAQHGRPDAPPHPTRASPGPPCSATRATWPTSSPTASPSWTSRSGRAGRTWCWRCSRC